MEEPRSRFQRTEQGSGWASVKRDLPLKYSHSCLKTAKFTSKFHFKRLIESLDLLDPPDLERAPHAKSGHLPRMTTFRSC